LIKANFGFLESKEGNGTVFFYFLAVIVLSFFFVFAVTATAHKVTSAIATTNEIMIAALLNSGTVGLGLVPDEVLLCIFFC